MRSQLTAASLAIFLSAFAGPAIYFHTEADYPAGAKVTVALFLMLGAAILLFLPSRHLLARAAQLSSRMLCLSILAALVAGWLATYAIPLGVAPAGHELNVSVVALGTQSSASKGHEVWVQLIVNGNLVPPSDLKTDGSWTRHETWLVANNPIPSRLEWKGTAVSAEALFISHPWSGKVEVAANGHASVLDLYSATPSAPRIVQLLGVKADPRFLVFPKRNRVQRWVQACDAVTVATALLWLFVLLSGPGTPRTKKERYRRLDTLVFSAPSIGCSLLLLGIFYPGIMSSDSLGQWEQATTGVYSDWHPYFHSLLIACLRLFWNSPAMVALCQATALGLATGWLITETLRATHAPRAYGVIAAWACALCPIVIISSITLWKDVPYSAAVVAITAGCVRFSSKQRLQLDDRRVFAASTAILLACMLFRHNGPPVALAALAFAWLVDRSMRRMVASLAVAVLALFILLSGPIQNALHVKRAHLAYTLELHHIAAHVARGEPPIDPHDRQLLEAIKPNGPLIYDCASVNPTIFEPDIHNQVAAANVGALGAMLFRLILANPKIELDHLRCVSGLVWSVTRPAGSPLYLYTTNLYFRNGHVSWISENRLGLHEHSLFPELAQALGEALLSLSSDYLWRPAGYLYLLLFALAVVWYRTSDLRIVFAVGGPVLMHSAVLVVSNLAQDARYQLPIYIVALATAPLLLRARHGRTDLLMDGQ